ncbi:hypothetical protein BC941DRAFT_510942 [Chlamydoabsidia padenii]|nr:hypothetical protein BC941DRAFT_510942 [Chlamydoabsidia padenii]
MTSTAVRVALRVRPLTEKEQCSNTGECLTFIPNEPQVLIGSDKSFTYDYVFDTKSTQAHVYSSAIAPLLHKFINGFNATVLAYGQTGAGKTFSMGLDGLDNTKDKENQGIVPRCILELFHLLQERTDNEDGYSYEVLVSFLELHNEDLIDLLNPPIMQKRRSHNGQPSQLSEVSIREDIAGNIYWTGVKEERCHSPDELLSYLEKGSLCRTTGSTEMNTVSSRSHAMFTVTLKQQCLEQQDDSMVPKCLNSKFHFVDLAGSERLKRTNAEGDRAKEGIAINAGLLALGNVISALGDESRKSAHVPYRDSKLTRLLQDSLGGNSQTLMMACVSPSDINFGETLNTLRYANRARNIKNRVMINQDFAGDSMEINQLRSLVARLRMDISLLRSNGLALSTNNTDDHSRLLQNEISHLRERLQTLTDDMLEISTERDTLLMERESIIGDTAQSSATNDDQPSSTVTPNPLIANYLKSIQELNTDLLEAKARIEFLENSRPPPISPSSDYHHPQRRRKSGTSGHSKRRYGRPGRISTNNSSTTTTTATNPSQHMATSKQKGQHIRKRRSQPPPKRSSSPSFLHKNHQRRSSDNGIGYYGSSNNTKYSYLEDEDEGYVNDVQDENMRNDFKESIAKARADIRKGMEFLELIKPGDENDFEMWDKELKIMMKQQSMERGTSDEGTFSASSSPIQLLEESDMPLSPWFVDSDSSSLYKQLSNDSSVDMDIRQQNPKLVRMLSQIQSDIKVKEELVCHLEKSETEYMLMRRKFDDKINRLQDQLAELQEDRDVALKRTKGFFKNSSGSGNTSGGLSLDATHQAREKQQLLEIRQAYETKMKHLLTEIQELKRKYSQTANAMHVARNQNESLLKSLRASVDTLKTEKKQMVKRMKQEADRVRDQITHQERRIQQLQRQHSEATMARRRLERERDLQKQTLKKRNEEVIMNNSQLKQLTCIMKKAVREGGVLDERLLGKISHIIGGNFAVLAHGSLGFPLRGGGYTRSNNNNNGRRNNNSNSKQVSSIPLQVRATRKKILLDKALSQYVQGKQAVVEMEQILVRRERLSDEKQDLMNERRHIYLMEKERADETGEPMDTAAIDFMDERIELVSAEISYLSSRIHGLQMEAAASDANNQPPHHHHHRIEKHVTFADEIVTDPPPSDEWADMDAFEERYSVPSNAAPDLAYDITIKLLKSLKADECKKVSEAMLKDIMDLRMAEYNRQMTMQNLERSVVDMRRTLIVMKRAAVASTVENERRIRRLEGASGKCGTNPQEEYDEMDLEAMAAMDRKMEEYISSGNTIFDKIYEDGLRGMISDNTASILDYDGDDGSVMDEIDHSPDLLLADDSCSDTLLTPSSYTQTPTTPAGGWSVNGESTTPQHDYHYHQQQQHQQQRIPSGFSFSETTETAIIGDLECHKSHLTSNSTVGRVDTKPSPDRFYNMIHKRLSSPLSQDDDSLMLPLGMTNPEEFRRMALEQTPPTEHYHIDLRDDSSTSSIRSSHVRQSHPMELPPTPTVLTEKEFDHPPLSQHAPMLGMTTPATTPNHQRSSSLQHPSSSSPLLSKSRQQQQRNSLPPSFSSVRNDNTMTRSSSVSDGNNVFDRLASASTRASRAKVHHLSY